MRKLNPAGEHAHADYVRRIHRATPPEGTTLEDVKDPAFWGHVAEKMTQYDRIEVIPQGGAWFAELLVVNCSKVHAKVAVLSFTKLSGDTTAKDKKEGENDNKDELFDIQFKGPQRKWSVLRKADKAVLKEEFTSKDDAAAWLVANRANLLA